VVRVYVPTHGRCDQHAVEIDGERVGLLGATDIGRAVAKRIRTRPSVALIAEVRRDEWRDAIEQQQ
jgi:phosphoglycerate dehydrogenase-like enzyme